MVISAVCDISCGFIFSFIRINHFSLDIFCGIVGLH